MPSTSALFKSLSDTGELVYPGLNNAQGLLHWRNAVKTRRFANCKGVDVVMLGDSILFGSAAATNVYSNAVMHQIKVFLQAELNPSGVVGGFGYFPTSTGQSTFGSGASNDPLTESAGSTAATHLVYAEDTSAAGAPGGGARQLLLDNNGDADTQALTFFAMDNSATTVPFLRDKFSAFQLAYADTGQAGSQIDYDTSASSGSSPARGAGTVTGSINTSGTADYSKLSSVLTVTNAFADARIKIRPATTSTAQIQVDGLILFNGDERCGIRVHNLCNPGSRLVDYSANSLTASITRFGQGGYEGACNAGLVVICDMINNVEALYGGSLSLLQIKAGWTAALNACRNCATRPSVLVIIPPKPTAYVQSFKLEQWEALRSAWVEVAGLYTDMCAIFDFTANPHFANADYSDGVHNTVSQQTAMASTIAGLLIEGTK